MCVVSAVSLNLSIHRVGTHSCYFHRPVGFNVKHLQHLLPLRALSSVFEYRSPCGGGRWHWAPGSAASLCSMGPHVLLQPLMRPCIFCMSSAYTKKGTPLLLPGAFCSAMAFFWCVFTPSFPALGPCSVHQPHCPGPASFPIQRHFSILCRCKVNP